jgi:hypothetical protein
MAKQKVMKVDVIDKEAYKIRMLRYSGEGSSFRDCCLRMGINWTTGNAWRREDAAWYKKCKEAMEAAKAERIESLLEKLAEGHDSIEESETWIEEKEDGTKVQRHKKIKRLPPNEKAIAMLSKKYAKEFSSTDINITQQIGITIKDRALTIEERLNLLKADKDEGQAIEIIDYKEIV